MIQTPVSEIKKFIKTFFFIFAGIVVCDQLIGNGLKYLYFKQKSGLLYRTTYSIDSTKADYIIVGSSRANHDYDPRIFEMELGRTFYNCGRDKQGLIYSCAVLSAILERYRPKYIIIDIRPDEFTLSDAGTLSPLLPYYNNKAVRPYADLNSKFESIKVLSKIYPYNSLLSNLAVGLTKSSKQDYKGYIRLDKITDNSPLESFVEDQTADTLKMTTFFNLMHRVSNLQIPVMLVISPIRYKCFDPITISQCILLQKTFKNISFLNFTNDKSWFNYRFYSDNNHLNSYGAAVYSKILAQRLARND